MKLLLGIYSKKTKPDPDEFSAMLEDFSLYEKRKIQFKIIGKLLIASYDPSGTDPEPLAVSMDGSSKLFLGGHIYNLNKLAETFSFSKGKGLSELPQYFINNTEKFLSDANGIFSLVYYNTNNNELIIANDTFGLYPLFIYEDEDCFIFSNEFEPIIKYKNFDNKLDYDAIAEFFTFGSPLAGKTFFKRIRNLAPATILRLKSSNQKQRCYFNQDIGINYSGNIEFFGQQIAEGFHKAVQSRANLRGKKSSMLTGGLDTRFILLNLTETQREEMDFLTFITPGLDPEKDKDVMVANMISEKFNLHHKVVEYEPWLSLWQKDFDLSFFDIWREGYSELVMGGIYGGEFLSGHYFGLIPKEVLSANKRKGLFTNLFNINKKWAKTPGILNKDTKIGIRNPHETLDEEIDKINSENKVFRFAIEYLTRGFFTQIYGGICSLHVNPYIFPTKMLVPFLDIEYLKILLSIPVSILNDERQLLYNTIYKNHIPALNDIPTSNISFAQIESNCIRFIKDGIESKDRRVFRNSKVLSTYMNNKSTWNKNIYNRLYIEEKFKASDTKSIRCFFDFESWYLKYVCNFKQ